jgi:hypothetical protein
MIGFESDEVTLQKLRARLRNMTDEQLIQFGKSVRELAAPSVAATANPFQRQLEEARAEWKRRRELQVNKPLGAFLDKDRCFRCRRHIAMRGTPLLAQTCGSSGTSTGDSPVIRLP